MQKTFFIFGSCVTRDIFSSTGQDALVAGYVARQSIVSCVSKPIAIKEEDINLASAWQRRMLLTDCLKLAPEMLTNGAFDYLIVDLIDERFGLLTDGDRIITNSNCMVDSGLASQLGFVPIPHEGKKAMFRDACAQFAEMLAPLVRQGRVILHEAYWAREYVQNGTIYKFDDARINFNNGYLSECYGHLKELLPEMIVLPQIEFLADANHRWGLAGMHYVAEYYEERMKQIKEIAQKTGRCAKEAGRNMDFAPSKKKMGEHQREEYPVKKLDYSELGNETFQVNGPLIYEIMWDGLKYEILVNHKPGSDRAVVFGSGALSSKEQKALLPIYNRVSWMDDLSCTGIWYADPTLYQDDDLLLGWCYGTNERWVLRDTARLIQIILGKLSIRCENVLYYGSSGGGYTSILLATMLRGKATVVNSQFELTSWLASAVRALKKAVLQPGEELLEERISAAKFMAVEGYVPRIHILENAWAEYDVAVQLPAFLKGLLENNVDCRNQIHIELFSAPGGHNGRPGKEESLVTIETDVRDGGALPAERVLMEWADKYAADQIEQRNGWVSALQEKVKKQEQWLDAAKGKLALYNDLLTKRNSIISAQQEKIEEQNKLIVELETRRTSVDN